MQFDSTKKLILGLDIGTASIGWCLIDNKPALTTIIDAGVRIFPEGMDRSRGEKSLNQDRQVARSLRRQTYRRARRKQKLLHALQTAELLPKSQKKLDELFSRSNPYQLRAMGLDKQLTPHQFGRALYHLGQRRGYLSNRKTGLEKDGAVAKGINALQSEMQDGKFRTVGEYFASLDPSQKRIRGCYTHRSMYQSEFNALWQAQLPFNPGLNEAHRQRIEDAIFFQRPLKSQRHLIGNCIFEPDRKRAYAATLAAQEFRLWQNINNLKILHQATGEERWLTDEERLELYGFMGLSKTKGWALIKRHLGFLENDRFNLERVRKSGLLGNQTAAIVSGAIGKKSWNKLSNRQQEQLVFDLINIESEAALKRRLISHYELPNEKVEKLVPKSLELPKGVMHLSHKAIRKILPCLNQVSTPDNRGITYDKACEMAGYKHSMPDRPSTVSLLPLPTENLRNPLVERALFQVRRVVNAIIREYGKPEIIRIEMARDIKNTAKQRGKIEKQNKENEKANQAAEKFLREEMGFANPSRQDKLKYRLWLECNRECPFTGESISAHELFVEPIFEIEHIIPYTLCLDDGFMNKTLCHRDANREKGKRTPYDAFSGNQNRYDEIISRANKLPPAKFRRFARDAETIGDFVSQQLNETRYIAVKTKEFLEQLKDVRVEPIKGGVITAQLRHAWGLNNLLGENGEKTRLDHRHHAVDALVTALTTRKTVQAITQYVNTERALHYGEVRLQDYPAPISSLRQKAEKIIREIIVSHKANHKISGPLHNEFFYSLQHDEETPRAVIRKNLVDCKDRDLEKIRDPKIRQLALDQRSRFTSCKEAFENADNPFGMTTKSGRFVPIKKVRIAYNRSLTPIGKSLSAKNDKRRNVWTRGNHHIEIFECTDKKSEVAWGARVVSTLEATLRNQKSSGTPVIQTDHGEGKRFVMAFHPEDMVELDYKGQRLICRVQKMDMNNIIVFREHQDADIKNWKKEIRFKPSSLKESNPKLLQISCLGKVKE